MRIELEIVNGPESLKWHNSDSPVISSNKIKPVIQELDIGDGGLSVDEPTTPNDIGATSITGESIGAVSIGTKSAYSGGTKKGGNESVVTSYTLRLDGHTNGSNGMYRRSAYFPLTVDNVTQLVNAQVIIEINREMLIDITIK